MPPRTERIGQTAPVTSVDLAGQAAAGAAAAARNQGQAVLQLSQTILAAGAQRRQDFQRLSATGFAQVNEQALALKEQSDAQDTVVNGTIEIDRRLQELVRNPDVAPLDYAAQAEAIVDDVANKSVAQSGGIFGSKMQKFVRGKFLQVKAQKVPAMRREGFKRETEDRLASLQQRNFTRRAELYAPGTDFNRKNELITEIITDIQSHAGIHISEDKAQAMVEREGKELNKNNLLQLALTDPSDALKLVGQMNFNPQEQLGLTNQIRNIIAVDENERRKLVAAAEKREKQRAEAIYEQATVAILLEGADPRQLAADPQISSALKGPQIQSLVRFHSALQKKSGTDKRQGPGDFLRLQAQYSGGALNPTQLAQDLAAEVDAGSDLGTSDINKLMADGLSAWNREQTLARDSFRDERNSGESRLKRALTFESSLLSFLSASSQSELNFALNGAISSYRDKVRAAQDRAIGQEVDPFRVANPTVIADETLIQFLPAAMKALGGQKVRPDMFDSIVSKDTKFPTRESLNKELVRQEQQGIISPSQRAIMQNLGTLAREFNRLSNTTAGVEEFKNQMKRLEGVNQIPLGPTQ